MPSGVLYSVNLLETGSQDYLRHLFSSSSSTPLGESRNYSRNKRSSRSAAPKESARQQVLVVLTKDTRISGERSASGKLNGCRAKARKVGWLDVSTTITTTESRWHLLVHNSENPAVLLDMTLQPGAGQLRIPQHGRCSHTYTCMRTPCAYPHPPLKRMHNLLHTESSNPFDSKTKVMLAISMLECHS